jgi:tetratricopeptide (TPR) repeat protein
MRQSSAKQIKKKPSSTAVKKKANTKAEAKGKAAANSTSTGALGVTFENRVQAVKLLHMCMAMPSPGIPEGWTILEMRFQARVLGPQTDDLVCTVKNSVGEQRRVLLQMKSGLTAQKSDKAFRDAIGGAWLDFQNANEFSRGQDRIVIVYDADSRHRLSGAAFVVKAANMSLSAKEWLQKNETEGVGNQLKRNALAAFRDVAAEFAERAVDDEELYQFLRHLTFLSHDLLHEGTPEQVQLLNWTRTCFLSIGANAEPSHVWSKLVTICNSLNGDGAGVSLETIGAILGDDLARAFKVLREASLSRIEFGSRQEADGRFAVDVGASLLVAPGGRNDVQEAVPAARDSSANKLISGLLDKVNIRIKEGKYKDAMSDLSNLGEDMKPFDAHQKARWYLMRGVCNWHLDQDDNAANDFLKAAELCDDDDKLAAARARGWLLKKDVAAAVKAGEEALERFPQSLSVWLITKNAQLAHGVSLKEQDIPVEHRREADAYQLVAWSMHRDGEVAAAASVARNAMKLPSASFFTRDLALAYTLESVIANSLNVAFHMLTSEELELVSEVAQAFEPTLEKLWGMQSDSTVRYTIRNLGYAYILLKSGNAALKLLSEARSRNIVGPEFIRLELEAHLDMDEPEKALESGAKLIDSMPSDALVTFAQIAATAGNAQVVEQALGAASRLTDEEEKLRATDLIAPLHWDCMMKAGRQQEVIDQLDGLNLHESTSMPLLVQASHLLRRVGQGERSNACLDRLKGLVTSDSSPAERYLAATALLYGQRFEESVNIYVGLLRSGVHSELHNNLLHCYIRLGAHAKAKKVLDAFPAGWMVNTEARHMAIQLGQIVGDGELLKQLSIVQLKEAPEKAMSWIFRVMMAGRESHAEMLSVLAKVPEVIHGTTRELTQLAICEMSNGFEARGLRRAYRMRRMSLTDVDVAASYLSAPVAVRRPLPNLEQALPKITPGSYFTVVDTEGREFTRVIDPPEFFDLPSEGDFRPASNKDVVSFLGATVGDEVMVPQTFDSPKVFKVVAIGSAYRYLLDNSHKLLKESIGKSAFLTIMELPKDDQDNLDFSQLKSQVLKSAEAGREVMEAYRTVPLTIGGICGMLHRGVFDAICSWPSREAKLDVGGGAHAERSAALRLLEKHKSAYVIDAATLIELARVDCLHLLSKVSHLLCSTKSYELIRGELEESRRMPSAGTAIEHEGELALVEVSEKDWKRRLDLLQSISSAVEKYCDIRPSYGPEDFRRVPQQLREVISSEETAVIMLAVESGAVLFCMDARLRMLASMYCGLNGVWPQVFLNSCLSNGYMSQRDYSVACLKFFMSSRNFTSLNDADLLFAMYQGGAWPGVVLEAFKEHIAEDSVEFESALNVTLNFLAGIAGAGHCQLGFFVEVASLLTEGLGRHAHCGQNLAGRVYDELRHAYGVRSLRDSSLVFLKLSLDGAVERARLKKTSTFKGTVLFCGSPPWLMSGITHLDTAELIQLNENHDASGATQVVANTETSGKPIEGIE